MRVTTLADLQPNRHIYSRSTGKSGEQMRADEQAASDAMPLVTRCAFCDKNYAGTAGEGRIWADTHRASEHPDKQATKRARRRHKLGGPLHGPGKMHTLAEQDAAVREAEWRRSRAGGETA